MRTVSCCLALLALITLHISHIYAVDFDVANYNAFPDDGKDDTSGITSAISAARAMNGTFARVVLHPGTYVVNSKMLIAKPCNNIVIEGNGATVLFNVTAIGFSLTDCNNVTLQNLYIDYNPLPFTGGKVLSVNATEKSFDLLVAAPHTADERPMDGYITFDLDRRRFGVINAANTTIRSVDVYQTSSTKASVILSQDPLTVRFYALSNIPSYLPGQNLVVRYQIYVYNCIDIARSDSITVLNTTVWTCPGMGFVASHSSNIRLDRFNVMPKDGRWMSSAADGTNMNNVRGTVEISNGYYEGMGDDAINIHNNVMVVWGNNGTIALSQGRTQPSKPDLLLLGDVIGFATPDDPFHPYLRATITSVNSPSIGNFTYCTFDVDVAQVAVNDVAVLESIATVHIYNVTVSRNRARGFLINNRQSLIENCTFDQITGPAVLMDCDAYNWWEGACTRHSVIRYNRFIDSNYGTAQRDGLITLSAAKDAKTSLAAGVFQNITFEFNSFEGPVARSYFLVGSASNVTIVNNVFDNTLLPSNETIAVICSSTDVLISCNELAVELSASQTIFPQGLKNLTSCTYHSSNINADEAFIGVCLPPVVTPASGNGNNGTQTPALISTPVTQPQPIQVSGAQSVFALTFVTFAFFVGSVIFY